MKKLFAILTMMVLAMSAFAYDFSAVCETGQTLHYNIHGNNNQVVVMKHLAGDPEPTGDLIIPETVEYEGTIYTVVEIWYGAFENCWLTSVQIPNSVTKINNRAFHNCTHLSNLVIGALVNNIDIGAFVSCIGLQTIYCYAQNPPTINHFPGTSGFFHNTPIDIPVYVSCLTIDQYQTDPDWSRFINFQAEFNGTASLTVGVNNPDFGTAEIVSLPTDCDHPTATVRATVNPNHRFSYWKRGVSIVSFDSEYTFVLNENYSLVACFDCLTIVDTIAFPDHVIARNYNVTNQVTDEYVSDFSYDQNGMLDCYYFAGHRNSTFSFFEYPSKPSVITIIISDYPDYDYRYTTERYSFTYQDDRQIRHCDHHCWTPYYEEYNVHYDYYYNNHRLYQKETSRTEEDGELLIVSINRYSYENGYRTRIDSALMSTFKPISVTTNHFNERQLVLSSLKDTYDNTGTNITSRSLKTYTYTESNKKDSIISQVENDGVWENTGIAHYIYDFKNRVIEYQTGSWSAENAEWNITKKVLYDFNDETQTVAISFWKKDNGEWMWDVFTGQSLFNDSRLDEWEKQLKESFSSYYYPVNQFEISMHYNTVELSFPILSEWYYEILNDDGSITYQHLEYTADTAIADDKAKVIVRTNQIYDKDKSAEVTHEYIKEQDNKVYWWNKELQEFTTLYDYNAQAGDEWEIKVGLESIMVHVDTVEAFEYQGETHKLLRISDANDWFSGDIVVEYGHLTSFFPEKLMNKRADYTVNGLRCYWVGDALLYHQGDEDCDAIYNEIHEVDETLADSFQIYPNPTDNLLYVIPNTVKPSSPYHITNLLGQTLMSGTLSDSAIDVSSLPKGLYFLTVDGQTVKLMKQ